MANLLTGNTAGACIASLRAVRGVYCSSTAPAGTSLLPVNRLLHIADFAMSQIQSGLLDAGLSETSVQAYLQSPPELTRTHERREVVFLTRTREHAMALDFAPDTATVSRSWNRPSTAFSAAVRDLGAR